MADDEKYGAVQWGKKKKEKKKKKKSGWRRHAPLLANDRHDACATRPPVYKHILTSGVISHDGGHEYSSSLFFFLYTYVWRAAAAAAQLSRLFSLSLSVVSILFFWFFMILIPIDSD